MALQRWKMVVTLTTLFMCVSHSALGAVKTPPVLDSDMMKLNKIMLKFDWNQFSNLCKFIALSKTIMSMKK